MTSGDRTMETTRKEDADHPEMKDLDNDWGPWKGDYTRVLCDYGIYQMA